MGNGGMRREAVIIQDVHTFGLPAVLLFSLDGYENKIEVTFFSVALDLLPEVPEHREVVNCVMGQIFRLEQIQEIRKSKALKILRIESP